MNIVVPDTCTILKWLLDESDCKEQALMLYKDYIEKKIRLRLPIFWAAEIGNVLGIKHKEYANEYFSYFLLCRFIEISIGVSLASLAFDLMKEFPKISFYDACYHALALQEGGVFVTADKKYYEMIKNKGGVMYLGDYGK